MYCAGTGRKRGKISEVYGGKSEVGVQGVGGKRITFMDTDTSRGHWPAMRDTLLFYDVYKKGNRRIPHQLEPLPPSFLTFTH